MNIRGFIHICNKTCYMLLLLTYYKNVNIYIILFVNA